MAELSIVLPVYDVDPYLNDCLDSIEGQSFKDWECILVDDGSTDFSGIICDGKSRKDNRFRVIHQENQGVSAARNAGIEAATAPLLAFIDPDDFVSENYFSCMVRDLSANGAEIAISNVCCVHENGDKGIFAKVMKRCVLDSAEIITAICKNTISCDAWGKVFSSALWGEARFPIKIDLSEDLETVPPVIIRAKTAVCSPESVYFYRIREQSLLHGTVSKERAVNSFRSSKTMVERLTEYFPDRRRDFEQLRFQHDSFCFMSYLKSGGGAQRKQSLLFQLQEFRHLAKGGMDDD